MDDDDLEFLELYEYDDDGGLLEQLYDENGAVPGCYRKVPLPVEE